MAMIDFSQKALDFLTFLNVMHHPSVQEKRGFKLVFDEKQKLFFDEKEFKILKKISENEALDQEERDFFLKLLENKDFIEKIFSKYLSNYYYIVSITNFNEYLSKNNVFYVPINVKEVLVFLSGNSIRNIYVLIPKNNEYGVSFMKDDLYLFINEIMELGIPITYYFYLINEITENTNLLNTNIRTFKEVQNFILENNDEGNFFLNGSKVRLYKHLLANYLKSFVDKFSFDLKPILVDLIPFTLITHNSLAYNQINTIILSHYFAKIFDLKINKTKSSRMLANILDILDLHHLKMLKDYFTLKKQKGKVIGIHFEPFISLGSNFSLDFIKDKQKREFILENFKSYEENIAITFNKYQFVIRVNLSNTDKKDSFYFQIKRSKMEIAKLVNGEHFSNEEIEKYQKIFLENNVEPINFSDIIYHYKEKYFRFLKTYSVINEQIPSFILEKIQDYSFNSDILTGLIKFKLFLKLWNYYKSVVEMLTEKSAVRKYYKKSIAFLYNSFYRFLVLYNLEAYNYGRYRKDVVMVNLGINNLSFEFPKDIKEEPIFETIKKYAIDLRENSKKVEVVIPFASFFKMLKLENIDVIEFFRELIEDLFNDNLSYGFLDENFNEKIRRILFEEKMEVDKKASVELFDGLKSLLKFIDDLINKERTEELLSLVENINNDFNLKNKLRKILKDLLLIKGENSLLDDVLSLRDNLDKLDNFFLSLAEAELNDLENEYFINWKTLEFFIKEYVNLYNKEYGAGYGIKPEEQSEIENIEEIIKKQNEN